MYFSFVLSAETAGCTKPDPAIFQRVAVQAQVEGALVYIGDDAVMDAQAAVEAGWYGIWLNRSGENGTSFPMALMSLKALPI